MRLTAPTPFTASRRRVTVSSTSQLRASSSRVSEVRVQAPGPAGGEDLGHHRVAHVGGQVGAHPADGGAHLGLGLVGVLFQLELDGDGHLPVEDGGVSS
jgi:hypothetical protein